MEQFTAKQERNGTAQSVGEQNTAQAGPDTSGEMAGLVSSSMADASAWMGEGAAIIHGAPGQPAGGPMWDWDSNLAIAEQPGEH